MAGAHPAIFTIVLPITGRAGTAAITGPARLAAALTGQAPIGRAAAGITAAADPAEAADPAADID